MKKKLAVVLTALIFLISSSVVIEATSTEVKKESSNSESIEVLSSGYTEKNNLGQGKGFPFLSEGIVEKKLEYRDERTNELLRRETQVLPAGTTYSINSNPPQGVDVVGIKGQANGSAEDIASGKQSETTVLQTRATTELNLVFEVKRQANVLSLQINKLTANDKAQTEAERKIQSISLTMPNGWKLNKDSAVKNIPDSLKNELLPGAQGGAVDEGEEIIYVADDDDDGTKNNSYSLVFRKKNTGIWVGQSISLPTIQEYLENLKFEKVSSTGETSDLGEIKISVDSQYYSSLADNNGVAHYYEKVNTYSPGEQTNTESEGIIGRDDYRPEAEANLQDLKYPRTFYQAYNEARLMTYRGLRGYLVTLSSLRETEFALNALGNYDGFLGGTRALVNFKHGQTTTDNNSEKISLNMNVLENPTNRDGIPLNYKSYYYGTKSEEWYWADGPEAGDVFLERAKGAVPKAKTGKDYEWTVDSKIWHGNKVSNDSSSKPEGAEMHLGYWQGKWNDFASQPNENTGYYVEYGGFEGFEEVPNESTHVAKIPQPVLGRLVLPDGTIHQTVNLIPETSTYTLNSKVAIDRSKVLSEILVGSTKYSLIAADLENYEDPTVTAEIQYPEFNYQEYVPDVTMTVHFAYDQAGKKEIYKAYKKTLDKVKKLPLKVKIADNLQQTLTDKVEKTNYDGYLAPKIIWTANGKEITEKDKVPDRDFEVTYQYRGYQAVAGIDADNLNFGSQQIAKSDTLEKSTLKNDAKLEISNTREEDSWKLFAQQDGKIGTTVNGKEYEFRGILSYLNSKNDLIRLNTGPQKIEVQNPDEEQPYTVIDLKLTDSSDQGLPLEQHSGNIAGNYVGQIVWSLADTPNVVEAP